MTREVHSLPEQPDVVVHESASGTGGSGWSQQTPPVAGVPVRRRARFGAGIVVGLLVISAAVAGGWAWGRVSTPPKPPQPVITSTTITANVGTLYENTRLTASITWPDVVVYPPFVDGIVTERTLAEPTTINRGTRLYSVDLMPIYAARGTVPSFRALELGVEGKDVTQLQDFLRSAKKRLGKSTGKFDEDTKQQVEAWQQATKQTVTGIIPAGQLQFFPELPVTGYLTPATTVGATVNRGGSPQSEGGPEGGRAELGPGVAVRTAAPVIRADLNPQQLRRVAIGTKAELRHEDTTLQLVATAITPFQEREGAVATFAPDGEGKLPPAFADSLPPEGLKGVGMVAEITPRTEGVVIPTTALSVAPNGSTTVRTADGTAIPVTVTVTVGGEAIVEGLDAGTTLRIDTQGQ